MNKSSYNNFTCKEHFGTIHVSFRQKCVYQNLIHILYVVTLNPLKLSILFIHELFIYIYNESKEQNK